MRPYFDLEFPVSQYLLENITAEYYDDFQPNDDGSRRCWGVRYVDESTVLAPEFVKFLHSIGIRNAASDNVDVAQTSLFRGDPNSELFIHQDSPSTKYNSWGINLSWGSDDSEMRWYKVKKDKESDIITVLTGRDVDTYTKDQLDLVATHKVTALRPTLIRTDIPHHAINYGNTYRWSISLRDDKNWTWEDAIKFFKPWIVR